MAFQHRASCYDTSATRDNFYKTNADNFFRNRKWYFAPMSHRLVLTHFDLIRLHLEFPELLAAAEPEVCGFLGVSISLRSIRQESSLFVKSGVVRHQLAWLSQYFP